MASPPQHLRVIRLKYSGRCDSCQRTLDVGQEACWSQAAKKVWCIGCDPSDRRAGQRAGGPRRAGTTQRKSDRRNSPAETYPRQGRPNSATENQRSAHPGNSPQSRWEQLCDYAVRCVEAEASRSLVRHTDEGHLWFSHSGAEKLVTGRDDSIPAPRGLAARLDSDGRSGTERSLIYGWPTVVMIGRDRAPNVAPLFVVQIEATEGSRGALGLHATTEPEFNLAVTTGGNLDPAVETEIRALFGTDLAFGDEAALIDLTESAAGILGFEIVTPLGPEQLSPYVDNQPGIYNAAISVMVQAQYTAALLAELRDLRTREDWASTGAAHLIPDSAEPQAKQRHLLGPLAAPLTSNRSQEETLERLRREPLTVVTGPPGTGKTQLVVNAVANAWLDSHTVLVTSTNNAAVDVAVERAGKDLCRGLLVRTGNREIREQVPDFVAAAVDEATDHPGEAAKAHASLAQAAKKRTELFNNLERLDTLDSELLNVVQDLEQAERSLADAILLLWGSTTPPESRPSPHEVERRAKRLQTTRLFKRLRSQRLRRQLGCIESAPLEGLIAWARSDQRVLESSTRLETKRAAHRRLMDVVGDPASAVRDVSREWENASLRSIRSTCASRVVSGSRQLADFDKISARADALKRAISRSLQSLRGWACTALSARSNFPLEPGLFDLVIVDEASQCSLSAVLPLAYRGKRLAIVGDPHQLQPIVPLGDDLLAQIASQVGFDNHALRRCGFHHKDGSAYMAFESVSTRPPVLLNEHYRCHPQIARWFNRTFYKNELVVLTDVAEMAQHDRSLCWVDVAGGTAERPDTGGSWLNWAEAEEAARQLAGVMSSPDCVSAAVVTTFTAQARLIDQLVEGRFGRDHLTDIGFVCGTAHRLQGDERDVIIFSSVLAPGIGDSGARWIENERNLLNVAVSRARRALIVLGHPGISDLANPTLASLRTYLREEVLDDGVRRDTTPVAEFRTDCEAEKRLLEAMQLGDLLPYAKLNVEGYELDFALLEQGIKLNIEVDGDQHLDARGRQRRQDITRDRRLEGIGWRVLRIPAWRCHRETDTVISEIRESRDRLVAEVT